MKTSLILSSILFFSTPLLADVTEDVKCSEIAFSQSVEVQDMSAFKSLIDPDARFVGNSVSRGIEDIATAWSVFFSDDAPAMKWRPQIIEVLDGGSWALSRGPYRMITLDPEGKPTERWGTFNSVWRKHVDGTWKVVFDAGNASAEPPSEEIQALLDEEVTCQ
jgi:ketosteroid isomerase-like protein